MDTDTILEGLLKENNSKIVMVVMDGLGDIRSPEFDNKTPLEYANTPNLDALAKESVCGRHIPVMPGITPGSGPGHLGIFGYNPLEVVIGRGVLEAVGLGIELKHGDVAARANFATLDGDGIICDRRAGRISTEKNKELCGILSRIKEIDGVKVTVEPGKGHRFVVVLRGDNLNPAVDDTDPQHEGHAPLQAKPQKEEAVFTAGIINKFVERARVLLQEQQPANGMLLRGISSRPKIPGLKERFKLEAAAIASYPMYRGIADLLGMTLLTAPDTIEGLFKAYIEFHNKYDFFFIHVKGTDQAGEDGEFLTKVDVIEKVDRALPILYEKRPNVLAITGDHSSPCPMYSHSWHPVPVLLNSQFSGTDDAVRFTENQCNIGGLGFFESRHLMTVLLANALRLDKYGA
ncbi:MAG: 2,3-bisphosphoglycerate-independent phosphoglycerate mutase [Bacillota bacterium]|nr:2,3-bisphosphoglycerate-independent phosphoglycerate mutase [Bacillota bacterium]MDD3297368.1 2,3-bisphosphoglycerate-independent phosphoglycerate mutase [Bacillota bacterium]MDD3851025.1 2,3-bisphosphoglycerate-independent phosphoglycerate mutase [Bacillota bacterium]MDD4707127.1 2,3-bisphosphoglycerate-independent phosphoglycerate mutase [Bacillota bacterium]